VPSAAVLQQRLPSAAPPGEATEPSAPAFVPDSGPGARAAAAGTLWRDSRGSFAASLDDADLETFGPGAGRAGARGNPDDIVGIVVDHLPASGTHH
jgi:hypothetical protein